MVYEKIHQNTMSIIPRKRLPWAEPHDPPPPPPPLLPAQSIIRFEREGKRKEKGDNEKIVKDFNMVICNII